MSNLDDIIEERKQESFVDPATATDEDALGIEISHHFHFDGAAICRTFARALEDANFHVESGVAEGLVR